MGDNYLFVKEKKIYGPIRYIFNSYFSSKQNTLRFFRLRFTFGGGGEGGWNLVT